MDQDLKDNYARNRDLIIMILLFNEFKKYHDIVCKAQIFINMKQK